MLLFFTQAFLLFINYKHMCGCVREKERERRRGRKREGEGVRCCQIKDIKSESSFLDLQLIATLKCRITSTSCHSHFTGDRCVLNLELIHL